MAESAPAQDPAQRRRVVREGLLCLHCHETVARKRLACAAGCGASYHPECWEALGRCGVPDCESESVRTVGRFWRMRRLLRLLVVSLIGAGSFVGKAKNVAGHIDRFSAIVLWPLGWFGGKPHRALPFCTFVFALTLMLNVSETTPHWGLIAAVWAVATLLLSPLGAVFQAVVFGVYSAFRLLLFQPLGWVLVVMTLHFSQLGERKPKPRKKDPLVEPGKGLFALTLVCFLGGWGVWFWRSYYELPPLGFGLFDVESLSVIEGMAITVGGFTLVPVVLLVAVHVTAKLGLWFGARVARSLEREERLLSALAGPAQPRPSKA